MATINITQEAAKKLHEQIREKTIVFISEQPDKTVIVSRNPNGTAQIRREVFGVLDLEWDSPDRTPEEWVDLQDNSYIKV